LDIVNLSIIINYYQVNTIARYVRTNYIIVINTFVVINMCIVKLKN